jgi:homospermidine synthase
MNLPIPNFSRPFFGQIVVIGFGSIGKGVLPLLLRHLELDPKQITIIDPVVTDRIIADRYGVNFVEARITESNYESILGSILGLSTERGLILNIANEVSSFDLVKFAAANNSFYIDTVVEPWPGFYFNEDLPQADQTNYCLREKLRSLKPDLVNSPTAISCCGANPGMVSWLLKEALLKLAADQGKTIATPNSQSEWALLMQSLGIKGVHIAEKDTQAGTIAHQPGWFINTWSAEGCAAECLQPAELGWGTHEETLPADGHRHVSGCKAAIYLATPGGKVRVNTWTPTAGPHFGFLVTHNEAISISDYYTVTNDGETIYRPTCHYAYHPSEETVKSLDELFGSQNNILQEQHKILNEAELLTGSDELGVLIYGHTQGAYWYGSTLSITEAKRLAPHQNATGLQVTSAIIAGIYYAMNHPNEGLLETDEMNFAECLELARPYLGKVSGHYTDWTPRVHTSIPEGADPWQFMYLRRP